MQERIAYELIIAVDRDDRIDSNVASYNSIIDEINTWVIESFQYGGSVYGSDLVNIIIPKMSNLDRESYFKLINIWFSSCSRKINIWFQNKTDSQKYLEFMNDSKCDSYII